jgi:hypothetical protein
VQKVEDGKTGKAGIFAKGNSQIGQSLANDEYQNGNTRRPLKLN